MKQIICDSAPKVVGPYSAAIEVNNFVYTSGQIGVDPLSGNLLEGIENQTRQVFKNLAEVLKSAETDLQHVVKATVFLQNLSDYAVVNTIYEEMFAGHKPARSAVQVAKLPREALLEIEMIAIKE
jgi:2-iminobutanoate/2-iminopropanoate deaminase